MIKGLPRKQRNSSRTQGTIMSLSLRSVLAHEKITSRSGRLVKDAATDDFFIVPLMCSGSSCSSGKYLQQATDRQTPVRSDALQGDISTTVWQECDHSVVASTYQTLKHRRELINRQHENIITHLQPKAKLLK